MTNYINFSAMSSIERHVFQSTGECSSQFHMGEDAFNQMLDEMIRKQERELVQEEV